MVLFLVSFFTSFPVLKIRLAEAWIQFFKAKYLLKYTSLLICIEFPQHFMLGMNVDASGTYEKKRN
jgi:hypothetical protein